MINVETVLDRECRMAISNAAVKVKRVRTVYRFFFFFFLVLGLFYLYLALNRNIEGNSVVCGIMGVAFIIFAFFGRKIIFTLNDRKHWKKSPEQLTAHYTFSEEGVVITGAVSESKYKWEAFNLHGTESHYLWVRRAHDNAYVIVDKNKLTAEDLALLEKWFSQAGNA